MEAQAYSLDIREPMRFILMCYVARLTFRKGFVLAGQFRLSFCLYLLINVYM